MFGGYGRKFKGTPRISELAYYLFLLDLKGNSVDFSSAEPMHRAARCASLVLTLATAGPLAAQRPRAIPMLEFRVP